MDLRLLLAIVVVIGGLTMILVATMGRSMSSKPSAVGIKPAQRDPGQPGHDMPRTLTRTYRGSPADTARQSQRDLEKLSARGYVMTGQIYSPGSYGCGGFLLALLLCVLLIGILIFVYMIVVKPPGTLVVTYELRQSAAGRATAIASMRASHEDASRALASLHQMRGAGHISLGEYESKKAEILRRL